jgi:cytochrome c oxidase subunit 2
MLYLLATTESSFWTPPQASTFGPDQDWLFNFIMFLNIFFFFLIAILVFVFGYMYRRSANPKPTKTITHSTIMELTWTIIPAIVVIYIFFLGFEGYKDMAVPPPNAYDINVTGYKWGWAFTYPNGYTDADLHVPVGVPIRLIQQSRDVIHSLYIPVMRIKKDVVPGRYNKQWFQATETGDFDIFCAGYCGTKHSEMRARCVVTDQAGFDKWMAEATNPFADHGKPLPMVQVGHNIYIKAGCSTCHSVDGSKIIGPTWKGSWGVTHNFEDGGSETFDENYVRESIELPAKHIVKGYPNAMPSFAGRFKDTEYRAIFAYMKSLSDNPKDCEEAEKEKNPMEEKPADKK